MPGEHLIEDHPRRHRWAALGIELGAIVIVAGVRVAITRGTVRFLFKARRIPALRGLQDQIGRSLLLGLRVPGRG